ncbi:Peroxisome chaperone and import receptor [Lobosporangium transversale]|uniref:Pex19 protein family-domain-containing protein n=1 Tax=Lobosporangium transversale TaxID=64571 RepID=A0A1Y2G9I5_9FUNG|nr:Pex19 protein family-domain-containing protein [Lobosporangium transversale]KAF9913873.1 Peroxisome chaperone and import receptor [Lobosporangium transversale]ORZ04853.1 Pex19 protein family-domain-containing protein [Lobosporangium transversale]|eukprot:XP_021876790.1 Pex19 protein family-domain-containing protein [Lobosporangium transversale]
MPEIKKNPSVEDDLDDDFLDGALDGFTSAKAATPVKPTATQKATGVATSSATSTSSKVEKTPESLLLHPEELLDDDDDELGGLDAEFSKQLASGMEELMKEMNNNPELQKSFEEMFKGLDVNGKGPASSSGAGATGTAGTAGTKAASASNFQDRIAKTMDKLKDSSEQVDAQVAEESEEALMAEMMRQMEGMAEGGDFQNVLEGMMEQLMSKDILYEPMLDLKQKYPQWLKDNKDKISAEEYARYEKQYGYVTEIVAFFDRPDFDEKSDAQAKSVIELMQGMQDCGQPPADILEELAPGMELGSDGVPKMPDMPECNMQ